jgi:hypothetical protein
MKLHKAVYILIGVIMILGLSACQINAANSTGSEPGNIAWLKTAGNVTVGFKAMMTFNVVADSGGDTFTSATVMDVPAVPITWMGNIFNGTVTDSGPGYSLTDQVHGSISSDGLWVNEMTFSRKINRQTSGGSYFSVTLDNVSINKVTDGGTPILANFDEKGTDVRKYISDIEYSSGGGVGTTYQSTDWNDTNGILRLQLNFATGKGERQLGAPPNGGM